MYFRGEASLHHIAELNPYVQVMSSTTPLNEVTDISFLRQYQVCGMYLKHLSSFQGSANFGCLW